MPTYQYACTEPSCAHEFELVQSFTDPAASECPVCGQRVRKVYGSVGVVFKGSGFYRTDSRAAAETKSGSAAGSGDGASSTSAKTDAAPAAKTESSTGSSTGASTGSSSGSSTSGAPTAPSKAAAS
jgi:putative FmdB family regulatory protein